MSGPRHSLESLEPLMRFMADLVIAEILEEVEAGALPNHEQARPGSIDDAESTTPPPR